MNALQGFHELLSRGDGVGVEAVHVAHAMRLLGLSCSKLVSPFQSFDSAKPRLLAEFLHYGHNSRCDLSALPGDLIGELIQIRSFAQGEELSLQHRPSFDAPEVYYYPEADRSHWLNRGP